MRITKVETWKVRVPMKPDAVNSPEYDAKDAVLSGFWNVPKFIVRLTTDDGLAGIGETGRGCPEEHVAACAAAVEGRDPRRRCAMNMDSDSVLKWFGIGLLVLAVGYFLFRAGVMVWRSIGTFRKVYQVSALPPRPAAPWIVSLDDRRPTLNAQRSALNA